jgi:diguanylate cyclase (GGDEF)-like protein
MTWVTWVTCVKAWLLVLAGIACVAGAGPAWAQDDRPGATLHLTDSERAYVLSHNPVTFCVDPDWWPFEVINEQERHAGIAADLLSLVASRVGLTLKLKVTRTWDESLVASKAGECRLLSFLNQTPDRDKWLIFTAPLLKDPNVLITREEHPFIADLASSKGKTIALPSGTAMMERVRRDFPNLTILSTQSEPEALRLVSERKADMTLRSLIVAAHTIKHEGWFNLKISGQIPGYDNQLRIGVIGSEVLLRDLLDKGVATLTEQERAAAVDRHVPMKVVTDVVMDYTLLKWLGALAVVAAFTSLLWMRRLKQMNAQLKQLSETDALTGLRNRNGLAMSFPLELDRALRYQRPLSVIMFDIDHFKAINDDLGHLMGDRVLAELGSLLSASARQVDTVCRWGGEEFLVICHETSADAACLLAERLLSTIRQYAFACQRPVTVSAGVAHVAENDTVDRLVQRADEALYRAKSEGRDRVCVADITP